MNTWNIAFRELKCILVSIGWRRRSVCSARHCVEPRCIAIARRLSSTFRGTSYYMFLFMWHEWTKPTPQQSKMKTQCGIQSWNLEMVALNTLYNGLARTFPVQHVYRWGGSLLFLDDGFYTFLHMHNCICTIATVTLENPNLKSTRVKSLQQTTRIVHGS